MALINLAAFQADYHNPDLKAADIARRWGIAEGSLAKVAQSHGIPSRKVLGIRAQSERQPMAEGLGMGCRPSCPGWAACMRHKGREQPACEIFSYFDENPAWIDEEQGYSGGVALTAALYLLEDEL